MVSVVVQKDFLSNIAITWQYVQNHTQGTTEKNLNIITWDLSSRGLQFSAEPIKLTSGGSEVEFGDIS